MYEIFLSEKNVLKNKLSIRYIPRLQNYKKKMIIFFFLSEASN